MVCCGAGTTFAGSDFLFYIVYGIEFLAVGFVCLILTPIGSSMVAGVVVGIDGGPEKCGFFTSCTVNVGYAFVSGIRVWFTAVLFVYGSL